MRTINIYEATLRILGVTKEELAAALGLAVTSIKLSDNGPTAIRTRKFIDELVDSFDGINKEKIIELRDALYETNMMTVATRGRATTISNFVIAMGYSYSSIAAELKAGEGDISRICRNSQHKSDELEEKLNQWLDAKYSVMSSSDQKRVDRRMEAIELTASPNTNPFRKELLEKGLLVTNDAKFRIKMETAISEAIGDRDKAIDELREYVKLLEEENETLRNRVEELNEKNSNINPDYISRLEKANETLREENTKLFKDNEALRVEQHAMNDEIMDLNRELEIRNTSNAGLQDGVTDLNQKVDELEAEIFRLEEEKDYLLKLKGPTASLDAIEDRVPNMVFYGNCTVNIYNGSRENSGT